MDFMDQLGGLDRPDIKQHPWMVAYRMERVTPKTLSRVIDECIASKLYALDLETTGLDNRVFWSDTGKPSIPYAQIVGYCLSPDGKVGYYIPVRHADESGERHEANLDPEVVANEMRRLVNSEAVAIFHNGKFDQEFLQFGEGEPIGEWDDASQWEDTLILAYLRDSRARNKGLKHLAAAECDMTMIELEELFSADQKREMGAGNLNFSLLDPEWEPTTWYAASDAICTYHLFKILHPQVMDPAPIGDSQATIYRIEKMCLAATRWMERNRINIDRAKVEELIFLGQQEWFESLAEVYVGASELLGRDIRPGWFRLMQGESGGTRFDPHVMNPNYMDVREEAKKQASLLRIDPTITDAKGKEKIRTIPKQVPHLTDKRKKETVEFFEVYDVTIPSELGLMLRELGVEGLQATEASGQVKTSKDELQRVIEDAADTFPFMGKVRRFRETAKALGSNLFPIFHDTDPHQKYGGGNGVCPDGTIKVGFNGFKVDTGRFATPQPRSGEFQGQVRWNLHSIPATYDKTKPACMLRMREAIRARPGFIMFAIDYAGVELRIVTNLSREPLWLDEFFHCSGCDHRFERNELPPHFCPKCGSDKIGDLHTLTALSIYGEHIAGTKEFKAKRQASKSLNFAMCYGGGGSAAMRAVQVDRDEGWRIKRQFDGTYKGLQKWWDQQHAFARRYKFVTTAFGRRYPLPDIDHEMGGFRSKAERNAVNGPVQGTSADITKLAMALIYAECKKRGWLRKVLMTITIHDELVFEIHKSIAEEAVEVISDCMCRNKVLKRLNHPVFYKVDVEFGDDWTVPFNLTEMRHNQGGGKWTAALVEMFPNSYRSYLAHGGTPVEGVDEPEAVERSTPQVAKDAPTSGTPSVAKAPFTVPPTGKDTEYVHVIRTERYSHILFTNLAMVIHKCRDRGTALLRVRNELGEDLLDPAEVIRVAPAQFQALADDYKV